MSHDSNTIITPLMTMMQVSPVAEHMTVPPPAGQTQSWVDPYHPVGYKLGFRSSGQNEKVNKDQISYLRQLLRQRDRLHQHGEPVQPGGGQVILSLVFRNEIATKTI